MVLWKRIGLVVLLLPLQLLLVAAVCWGEERSLPNGRGSAQQVLLSADTPYCASVAQSRLERAGVSFLPLLPSVYLSAYKSGVLQLHAWRGSSLFAAVYQGQDAIVRLVSTCCLRL